MRVLSMVLAEAANVMPDGRFNLIGGGIQRVFCPRLPAQVRLSLVVQLLSEPAESGMGARRLTIRLIDDDGHDLMPVLNSNIEFRDRRDANVLLDLNNLRIPKVGTYTFSILLDGMELQTWPVHREVPSEAQTSPPIAVSAVEGLAWQANVLAPLATGSA